jgi:hypothetical protein
VHELSTIKEVDTPISERNFKTSGKSNNSEYTQFVPRQPHQIPASNNSNNLKKQQQFTSNSPAAMHSLASLEESSLEHVTQMNGDANPAAMDNNNTLDGLETGPLDEDESVITDSNNSNNQSNNHPRKQTAIASTPYTPAGDGLSSNDERTLTSERKLLTLDMIRQRQAQLFNISLFDSSNGGQTSTSSFLGGGQATPPPPSQSQPALTADYAQMVFDSLFSGKKQIINYDSVDNVSMVRNCSGHAGCAVVNGSGVTQQQQAFKTESTKAVSVSSNKKWFDILASSGGSSISGLEDDDDDESDQVDGLASRRRRQQQQQKYQQQRLFDELCSTRDQSNSSSSLSQGMQSIFK